jgi:hypothetical protein
LEETGAEDNDGGDAAAAADNDAAGSDADTESWLSSNEMSTPSLAAWTALPPTPPRVIADFDLGGGASFGRGGGGGQAKFKI